MTALVTGAAGFVGRNVVQELLERGTAVRALVRDPAAAALLRDAGAEVVTGDGRDPQVMRAAIRGAGVVYHCAAAVGPRYSRRELRDVNLGLARNLLEAARQGGTGRVVLLTSVNVLGTRHLDPATEDLPCRRSGDPAADVKIDIEALAWEYQRRHGVDVTVLRPGLIYGPHDRINLPRMIAALRKGALAFIGSRDHVIPVVHVRDVVQAMRLAAQAPAARGRAYHITDGSRTTVGDFIDHLAGLLDCPPPRTVLPYALPWAGCLFFEFCSRSGIGQVLASLGLFRGPAPIARNVLRLLGTSRYFDILRAHEELGYAPRVGYREGLADAVRWLQEPSSRPAALPRRPEDALRARVREAICKHWVMPRPRRPAGPLSPPRVEELARAALDALLTRPFRVGPLPPPEVHAALLDRVRRRVWRGQPIDIAVGYGPLKNPNAVDYSRADWAEFFALCHLVAWHNKVCSVYPPGLRLQVVFDDSTLARSNGADRGRMDSYMDSVAGLTRALGFDAVFSSPVMQSSFTWLFHLGLYQLAARRVRRWERDPANRGQLARMDEFARRNLALPPGLGPGEQEQYLRRASHRFRVCWEAMQLSGLPKSKGRILALYLDGSQHHVRDLGLHLTTLDKGQVTQPWQGEGALLDNGHGKLEPFVLTAGRRPRHRCHTVEGLDLIPYPGFDRIAVARPVATPDAAPAVRIPDATRAQTSPPARNSTA